MHFLFQFSSAVSDGTSTQCALVDGVPYSLNLSACHWNDNVKRIKMSITLGNEKVNKAT